MAGRRKTIPRELVVDMANRRIAHLADSGTFVDQIRRKAIADFAKDILLEGNSYAGFRYMNPPLEYDDRKVWDDTRVVIN